MEVGIRPGQNLSGFGLTGSNLGFKNGRKIWTIFISFLQNFCRFLQIFFGESASLKHFVAKVGVKFLQNFCNFLAQFLEQKLRKGGKSCLAGAQQGFGEGVIIIAKIRAIPFAFVNWKQKGDAGYVRGPSAGFK